MNIERSRVVIVKGCGTSLCRLQGISNVLAKQGRLGIQRWSGDNFLSWGLRLDGLPGHDVGRHQANVDKHPGAKWVLALRVHRLVLP